MNTSSLNFKGSQAVVVVVVELGEVVSLPAIQSERGSSVE